MFKNIFFGTFVFLFVFIGVVNAHGTSNEVAQKPVGQNSAGLLPGDFFYFLDIFSEKIGTLFTFGDIPNIKRLVSLAEERLDEAQELSLLGRARDAGIAVKKYQTQINKALSRAKIAKKDGKNIDSVLSSIVEKTVVNQTVLANIYDKVSSSEKNIVKDAMKNSMNGYESALGEISKKKQVEIKPKIDKLLGDINKELLGLKNEGKKFPEVKMKYMNNAGEFSVLKDISNNKNIEKETERELKSSKAEKDSSENEGKEDGGNFEKENKKEEGDHMFNHSESSDNTKINREMNSIGNGNDMRGMFDN